MAYQAYVVHVHGRGWVDERMEEYIQGDRRIDGWYATAHNRVWFSDRASAKDFATFTSGEFKVAELPAGFEKDWEAWHKED